MSRESAIFTDAFFDGFTGAGLFGWLRRSGARDELVDLTNSRIRMADLVGVLSRMISGTDVEAVEVITKESLVSIKDSPYYIDGLLLKAWGEPTSVIYSETKETKEPVVDATSVPSGSGLGMSFGMLVVAVVDKEAGQAKIIFPASERIKGLRVNELLEKAKETLERRIEAETHEKKHS